MAARVCLILFVSLWAFWVPAGAGARAESLPCLVTDVPSGDSLRVVCAGTRLEVNLHGIVCPPPDEPYGRQARQFVERLVTGREVGVETVRRESPFRVVAKVLLENGKFLSHELLENGLARVDPEAASEDVKLEILEGLAKDLRVGLWARAGQEPALSQTEKGAPVSAGKARAAASRQVAATRTRGTLAAGAMLLAAGALGVLVFLAWRRRRL